MLLATMMDLCHTEFVELAKTWLLLGASGISLYEDGRVIAKYPEGFYDIKADLVVREPNSGLALQILGITGSEWQAVAETQLRLFVRLLTCEGEMESLTASLVETQDRLVALYDLTRATRGAMEIEDVLSLLIAESTRLLDAFGAFVVLEIPDQSPIIRQYTDNPFPLESVLAAAEYYFTHLQAGTLKDCTTVPSEMCNVVMSTLSVHPKVRACLGVLFKNNEISSPDNKLLKAITDQAGASLDNALYHREAVANARIETEMSLARLVQTALVPQSLPRTRGADVFGISIPASQVGGDFFFATSMTERPLTFYLGDVTGKGMPAAILMSMTSTAARSAIRYMPFSEPQQLVDRLNMDLIEDYTAVGMFVTVFVGMFDPDTHKLLYTNAGQSPVIYASPNQEPRLLEAADLPVGIFQDHRYSMQSLDMNRGDVLVITTDGFNETSNETGEFFGIDRMKELIKHNMQRSAQEIGDCLCTAVSEYGGYDRQEDDRTVFILKFTGEKEPFSRQSEMAVFAEYEQLRIPTQALRNACFEAGVSEDLIGTCELALQELLTNLVDHAYDGSSRGVIQVRLQVTANQVIIQTQDTGKHLDVDLDSVTMPDPCVLQEGGYGLAIIKSLMDDVSYRSIEGKNTWILIKNYIKE